MKRFVATWLVLLLLIPMSACTVNSPSNSNSHKNLRILSSTENQAVEHLLTDYAQKNGLTVEFTYSGTMETINKLNRHAEDYDAVWLSNSLWLYMLDNSSVVSSARSTSINPVVFGVEKSIAQSLGWVDESVTMQQIISAVEEGKLNFLMPSVTQTNSGATAYLGFLNALADTDRVLTSQDLEDPAIGEKLQKLFKGVTRSSGDDEFIGELFMSQGYQALVGYESSIIALNLMLEENGREPLYVVYPHNGLALSDSPFGFIDNGIEGKKETFEAIQSFLLSDEGQKQLTQSGRRAGYGGLVPYEADDLFRPEWGIHTDRYLSCVNFPSTAVIDEALNLYQSQLRKPSYTVFCLDVSGSMNGKGISALRSAMEFILTEAEASSEYLQFMQSDEVIIIPFESSTYPPIQANGADLTELLALVGELQAGGGTDLFSAAISAVDLLSQVDPQEYTRTVVLMTDGASNGFYDYSDFEWDYSQTGQDIPVYSIMFGSASAQELELLADFTSGKVFDGREDLIYAFRQVRGFN